MYVGLKLDSSARQIARNTLSGSASARFRAATLVAVLAVCLFAAGAAHGQDAGYMRVITASGHQMAGESTDPAYPAWIPLRQVTLPTPSEIAALAQESSSSAAASTDKSVHRPVVIIKDRDVSSLGLLGAMTAHQHFPEVDIVLTKNDQSLTRYKLTDATIISVRGGGTSGGMDAPTEQLRLNYAEIEIER